MGMIGVADRTALKVIDTGLVRSVSDYCCVVFGSAANTNNNTAKYNIQYQAFRVFTGATKLLQQQHYR